MPGEYGKIERKIWDSRTFKRLSQDAQMLWFYLCSCRHGNMLGLFILKPGYATEDLEWSKERLDKGLLELLSIERSNGKEPGMIKYDKENRVVFLKSNFDTNQITNGNQAKGAIKVINELPNTPLLVDLKDIIEPLYKDVYKDLWKALCEAVKKPFANTVTVSVAVAEEVTGEEKGKKVEAEASLFELPTTEDINECAIPKIKEYINQLSDTLYQESIFP